MELHESTIIESANEEWGDGIWQLNCLQGSGQRFKLVRFNSEVTLEIAIKLAKRYCIQNGLRFVFLEPAVTTIDVNVPDDQV